MRRISTRRSRKKVVSLPEELLIEILLRLQVPTLLRCKCVSKNWLRLLSSQYFVQSQLDYAIKNNPRILFSTRPLTLTPVTETGAPTIQVLWSMCNLCSLEYETSIYGIKTYYETEYLQNFFRIDSCNGLVCLWDRARSSVVLCNPATREHIKVRVPLFFDLNFHLGFGHDPLTNTYKLVKILYGEHSSLSQFSDCEVYVYVYTFGTKKWRRVSTSTTPFCLCNLKNRGPCLNGVVHWCSRSTTSIDSIIGFDVEKEEFRQLQIPWIPSFRQLQIPWVPTTTANQLSVCIGEIQGCLSLISTNYYEGITDIWYMKDYGVQESWTKLYSHLSPSYDRIRSSCMLRKIRSDRIQSFCILKKTETLISITSEHQYLYTYDRINNTVHQYAANKWDRRNGVHTYVESLVSIASLSMGKRQSQRNRRPPDRLNL